MESAEAKWITSPHPRPKAILGYCDGNWYATVQDSGTIVTFVKSGGNGKIYVAVKSKCIPMTTSGVTYYNITGTGSLSIISCPKGFEDTKNKVVEWTIDNIVPLFGGTV